MNGFAFSGKRGGYRIFLLFTQFKDTIKISLLFLHLLFLQLTGILQTGVPGDLAVLPVVMVFKFDFGTVPIHHRSTMDQIAKDLASSRSNATY